MQVSTNGRYVRIEHDRDMATEEVTPEEARMLAQHLQAAVDEAEAWRPPLSDEAKARVREVLLDNMPPADQLGYTGAGRTHAAITAVAAGLGIDLSDDDNPDLEPDDDIEDEGPDEIDTREYRYRAVQQAHGKGKGLWCVIRETYAHPAATEPIFDTSQTMRYNLDYESMAKSLATNLGSTHPHPPR